MKEKFRSVANRLTWRIILSTLLTMTIVSGLVFLFQCLVPVSYFLLIDHYCQVLPPHHLPDSGCDIIAEVTRQVQLCEAIEFEFPQD